MRKLLAEVPPLRIQRGLELGEKEIEKGRWTYVRDLLLGAAHGDDKCGRIAGRSSLSLEMSPFTS